jgi:hypothetical protein
MAKDITAPSIIHLGHRPKVRNVVGALIKACAALSIVWAISAIGIYARQPAFEDTAKQVLEGDKFNSRQVASIKQNLDRAPNDVGQASASRDAAILGIFLLEEQLKSGNREISFLNYNQLQSSVSAALARSPTDSFLWLAAFWLRTLSAEKASDLDLLRMSFLLGPNEGWVVIRRAPLALGAFGTLPPDLAEKAITDFAGLVRSGLSSAAAGMLLGPGWAVRNELINSLRRVDIAERRIFARALADKGVDGLAVPGVEGSSRYRPF